MHRILFLIMFYVLCVFSNFATARISGLPCNCTNHVMDCSHRNKSQVYLGEKCSYATSGYFEGNNLSDYPEILKFFNVVNMDSNLLTRLPHHSHLNANIRVLILSGNIIANTSNELQQCSSLERLEVSNNRLQSLEFLPEPCFLEFLFADNNYIASLQGPLRFCTQLISLVLDRNEVASIPANMFARMAELIKLSLRYNPLVTLSDDSLRGALKLSQLYLSGTELTTIPSHLFSGTPELELLSLGQNRLRDFPSEQIRGLAALQELRLSDNRIKELPILRNCCQQLQVVAVETNELRALSEEAVLSFVRGNKSRLYLNGNPLRARALRWTLTSRALRPFVGRYRCHCGGLRLHNASLADSPSVFWCVNAVCGPSSAYADWIAAVNATPQLRSGQGVIRPLTFATHEGFRSDK